MPKLWPEFIGDLQTWQAALGMLPSASGLVVTNNASTPNTLIDINADFAVLLADAAPGEDIGLTYLAKAVDLTINTTTTGANGLDTGAKANNTGYNFFIIGGDGQPAAGLASLSATAPTLPANYTHKLRVGWNITDSSGNFRRVLQRGNRSQFDVAPLPIIGTGVAGAPGTPTWVAINLATWIPPTAIEMWGSAFAQTANSQTIVAPNNGYGSSANNSNSPIVLATTPSTGGSYIIPFNLTLESGSIYWATNGANNVLTLLGWRDKVNAS